MKSKIRLVSAIFLIIVVFIIGALLYINSKMHKGLSGSIVKFSNADIRIEKARYVETKDGKKEWELEADSAQYFKSDNLIIFDNVKVTFYSKGGMSYTIKGKQGRLRNDTKDIDISGAVTAASADGYQLKTDTLQYREAVKQISTRDKVVFTGPNMKIEGEGFLADMVTERASVLANVRTVLKDVAM